MKEQSLFFNQIGEIMELIAFYQQVMKFQFSLDKNRIARDKELTDMFSGLSKHIWSYLTKNFAFVDGAGISQDTALFPEVSEKIASQKILEERLMSASIDESRQIFFDLLSKSPLKLDSLSEYFSSFIDNKILTEDLKREILG